jgi:hypothetical protein
MGLKLPEKFNAQIRIHGVPEENMHEFYMGMWAMHSKYWEMSKQMEWWGPAGWTHKFVSSQNAEMDWFPTGDPQNLPVEKYDEEKTLAWFLNADTHLSSPQGVDESESFSFEFYSDKSRMADKKFSLTLTIWG